MNMPIDMQSAIVSSLEALLGSVPTFGALVFEDSVLRVLDADDPDLPDNFIVIQPGGTEELERVGAGSARERFTLNITAITKSRGFAAALRAGRLGIKLATAGVKAGITVQGVQQAVFMPEIPMPPGDGRRWAAHVMPLQITYVQPLT